MSTALDEYKKYLQNQKTTSSSNSGTISNLSDYKKYRGVDTTSTEKTTSTDKTSLLKTLLTGTNLVGQGVLRGFEDIGDLGLYGISGLQNLFGANDDAKNTSDFASKDLTSYLLDKLAGYQTTLDSATENGSTFNNYDLNKNSLLKSTNIGGQVATGLGELAPSLVTGAVASGLGKAESTTLKAAKLTGALQAASQGETTAYKDTGNVLSALPYAALTGLGAYVIEGKKVPGINKSNILQEAFENAAQDAFDPLLKTTYQGTNSLNQYITADYYKQMATDALTGGVTAGILNMGNKFSNTGRTAGEDTNALNRTIALEKAYNDSLKEKLQVKERENIPTSETNKVSSETNVPKTEENISQATSEQQTTKKTKTPSKKTVSTTEQVTTPEQTKTAEVADKSTQLNDELTSLYEKAQKTRNDTDVDNVIKKAKELNDNKIEIENQDIADYVDQNTVDNNEKVNVADEKKIKVVKDTQHIKDNNQINSLIKDFKTTKNVDSIKKAISIQEKTGDIYDNNPKTTYDDYLDKQIKSYEDKAKTPVTTESKSLSEEDVNKVSIDTKVSSDAHFDKYKKLVSTPYAERKEQWISDMKEIQNTPWYNRNKRSLDTYSRDVSKLFTQATGEKVVKLENKTTMETTEDKEKKLAEYQAKYGPSEIAKEVKSLNDILKEEPVKTTKDVSHLFPSKEETNASEVKTKTPKKTTMNDSIEKDDVLTITPKEIKSLSDITAKEPVKKTPSKVKEVSTEEAPIENGTRKIKGLYVGVENDAKLKAYSDEISKAATTYMVNTVDETRGYANMKAGDPQKYLKEIEYKIDNNMRLDVNDPAAMVRAGQKALEKGDIETGLKLIDTSAAYLNYYGQSSGALGAILNKQSKINPISVSRQLDTELKMLSKDKHFKVSEDISLTPEEKTKILSIATDDKGDAINQKELENIVDKIKEKKLSNVRGTALEQIKAWRKFAMLGHATTHVRNVTSNILSKQILKTSETINGAIQDLKKKIGSHSFDGQYYTATLKEATNEIKNIADTVAKEEINSLQSKYDDTNALFNNIMGKDYTKELSDKVKTINADTSLTKAQKTKEYLKLSKTMGDGGAKFMDYVQTLSGINQELMGLEDSSFKKKIYSESLSSMLTANGIDTEAQLAEHPHLLEVAKEYALNMAKYGTFQQDSKLSNDLNMLKKKGGLGGELLDAMFPFTRTPINIAKEAIDYSPAGLLKTLTKSNYDLHTGKINQGEYLNKLTRGMTGSMVFALGMSLAAKGILKGTAKDSDKDLGLQDYSINVGGKSYSIDWAMPVAMPLVWGAVYNDVQNSNATGKDVINGIFEPYSNMTALDTLNNIVTSVEYNGVYGGATQMVSNYASQFIPAVSGDIAKMVDDTKRVSGSGMSGALEYSVGSKIPFVSKLLQPKIDVYGNEVTRSENVAERAFQTFVAPYTVTTIKNDDVSNQLKSLYSQTKDDNVLPSSVTGSKVTFDDTDYSLTDSEKTQYKKTYGTTVYNNLTDLFKTTTYQKASDEDKEKMVKAVYDYGKEMGKKEYLENKDIEYTNKTTDGVKSYQDASIVYAIKNDITMKAASYLRDNPDKYTVITQITDYDTYASYTKQLDKIRSKYTTTASKKTATVNYIKSLTDLNITQKAMLLKQYYSSINKYNSKIYNYIKNSNLSYDDKVMVLKYYGIMKETAK